MPDLAQTLSLVADSETERVVLENRHVHFGSAGQHFFKIDLKWHVKMMKIETNGCF